MKVVFDIEANALRNPTQIWCIVCKNIETNEYAIFRNVTKDAEEKERFLEYARGVSLWIGHNSLEYDHPVMLSLLAAPDIDPARDTLDTLVISRLVDYPRDGHSIEDYGVEFGYPKIVFTDFSKFSEEMVEYCKRDVDICHKTYNKYLRYINNPERRQAIETEHKFQWFVVNKLHENGFAFNSTKAKGMLEKVERELKELDDQILKAFPPRLKLIREVTPRATKHGTISRSSIPRALGDDHSIFTVDAPFSYCAWQEFNPSSHKQLIEVLNQAGWKPEHKTKTHIDAERELTRLKRENKRDQSLDLAVNSATIKLEQLKKTGWKIDEDNLNTLPSSAPAPARLLAKRILLEARRRTLTEWLDLVREDGRIHGKYFGIGAWTHRMAHREPNTANIPNEFDTQGKKKLLGKEMRSLWCAPKKRLLVGVDAEGIQLRIFAHYIDDPEFTEALVKGKKDDKTDPHSLNQRILGDVCKSRAAAKRFIYALLLGAGTGKLSEVLNCSVSETEEALDRLLRRYTGFAKIKEEVIPSDAKRGWFRGLDGRAVRIPGETLGSRKHLAMSGYLQTGEAVVMKLATLKWVEKLKDEDSLLVNLVHDEWQTETQNNMEVALRVARMQADSLREVGEELNLKCPLAGSYYNDDLKDYTIGTNWSVTH